MRITFTTTGRSYRDDVDQIVRGDAWATSALDPDRVRPVLVAAYSAFDSDEPDAVYDVSLSVAPGSLSLSIEATGEKIVAAPAAAPAMSAGELARNFSGQADIIEAEIASAHPSRVAVLEALAASLRAQSDEAQAAAGGVAS